MKIHLAILSLVCLFISLMVSSIKVEMDTRQSSFKWLLPIAIPAVLALAVLVGSLLYGWKEIDGVIVIVAFIGLFLIINGLHDSWTRIYKDQYSPLIGIIAGLFAFVILHLWLLSSPDLQNQDKPWSYGIGLLLAAIAFGFIADRYSRKYFHQPRPD